MKTLIFLLIIIILGVAIWYYMSGSKLFKSDADKITVTDTLVIVKDSIINANTFDTTLSGFYQGMLPCKNCEGIQRTIMFSDDAHFKMEELNWGKGTQARRTEGTWEKNNGLFFLSVNDKVISKYRLIRDSLINIENNRSRIPDSMSRQYVLFKKNTAPENPSWKTRRDQGVDIIGNGSDPAWSIEIDNEKFVLFKLTTLEKPIIVPIAMPLSSKDSIVYSIITEAGDRLKVSISSTFCNDGISDHLYEYKIMVWYREQVYKGCAVMLNTLM